MKHGAPKHLNRLPVRLLAAFALLAALLALPASADRSMLRPEQLTQGEQTRQAFASVAAAARRSTVAIYRSGEHAAMGAIVSADGYILTKASELRGQITCRLPGGRRLDATIVGVQRDHDLALLKVGAKGLKPVEWTEGPGPQVGDWVASVGMGEAPLAVGVLSVQRRAIPARNGVLGIRMGDVTDEGVKVAQVFPGSGAAKAGLQVDDLITHIDGGRVRSMQDLSRAVRKRRPGDVVHLQYQRDGRRETIGAILSRTVGGMPMSRRDFMDRLGGKLSRRASGFPDAIQHDSVLEPHECGGPLVDLDGKVIAINIARAGRAESYAIPADVVRSLLDELKSGRLKPASRGTDVDEAEE